MKAPPTGRTEKTQSTAAPGDCGEIPVRFVPVQDVIEGAGRLAEHVSHRRQLVGLFGGQVVGLGEVLGVYGKLLANPTRVSVDVGKLIDPVPTLAAIYYQGVHNFKSWF